MKYSDQSYNIRIELDTENCELTADELEHLQSALNPLRRPLEKFPVANLYVTIQYQAPSHDFRVKTSLRLPGRGLTTGDWDESLYPAFRRSIRKLVHKVIAYEDRLSRAEEISKHEKGTHQDVVAEQIIDPRDLTQAVEDGDYSRFRELTYPFEESVRQRAGRWIQRYPEFEAQLDDRFQLADIVEEVFLNAFERYETRAREVPFGDWLEHLIDPSLKLVAEATDEELENINFARTAIEAERPRD